MSVSWIEAAANTLFGRLRADAGETWRGYVEHEFVRALGDGRLPEACFRHYLVQDYRFLIHFARAYALAIYKSDDLAEMRAAAATVNGLLDVEMKLHVAFCADWGLDEAAMAAVPEEPANMAYTRYVLERGMRGDVLDLHAALAPCVVGYGEIGALLAADPATRRENHPYRAWIEMYAGDEYREVALGAIEQLDRLADARLTPARYDDLRRTFEQATRLEIGFWDMGLAPATASRRANARG